MKIEVDQEKTLQSLDELIKKCDGAAGRLIVTAMSRNDEVKEAMEMINDVSIILGQMAEQIEYPMEESEDKE